MPKSLKALSLCPLVTDMLEKRKYETCSYRVGKIITRLQWWRKVGF